MFRLSGGWGRGDWVDGPEKEVAGWVLKTLFAGQVK